MKGRDRAVCNLLRLTREMAGRDAYAERTGNDYARGRPTFSPECLVPFCLFDDPIRVSAAAETSGFCSSRCGVNRPYRSRNA